MTWVKGQSGNPRGKPPLAEELAPAIRRELRRRDPVTGVQNKLAIARVLVARAVAGEIEAIREVLNRVDGAVPRRLEHSGRDGGPIPVGLIPYDYRAVVADLSGRAEPDPSMEPAGLAGGPDGDRPPPGALAGRRDGPALGQDLDGR